jgi:hypothetical protein
MTSNIRFIAPFVFANAFFDADGSIDYESIGIQAPKESAPVRFDIERIVSWNYASETTITVHLENGSGYVLDCPIDLFDEFMAANGSI